jgi:hypothetical protein
MSMITVVILWLHEVPEKQQLTIREPPIVLSTIVLSIRKNAWKPFVGFNDHILQLWISAPEQNAPPLLLVALPYML